jgi:hypothetical protein
MMTTTRLGYFVAIGLMLGFAVTAKADLIYSCNSPADCNGNTYAVSVVSHTGSTYVMEYDIKVAGIGGPTGYTGSATDVVEAIGIKSFLSGNNISGLTVLAAPGGAADWSIIFGELDTAGTCAAKSGGTPRICLEATGGYAGAPLPTTFPGVLTWQFQFTDPTDTANGNPNGVGDIKFLYENTSDKKVGSLGSFPIDLQTGTGAVPEPSSIILLGMVLLGTCGAFRKGLAKN